MKQPGNAFMMVLIVLLSMFGPISTDMYLSGLPQMMDYFDTNESMMSVTLYSFMFAMAVAILIVGTLSDKYGRRPMLIFCMALYTIFSVMCSLSPNIWCLILFRVIQAIGAGGAISISMALIKDLYRGPKMKKALTVVSAVGVIGPIASPIIGALLIETIDWKATFWAPAIVSAICLVMTFMCPETLKDEERYTGTLRGSFDGMKNILRFRNFMLFGILTTAMYIPFFAYLSVSAYIYEDSFGLSPSMYSIMLALAISSSIVFMEIMLKVQNRTSTVTVVRIFMILGLAALVLMFAIGSINEWTFLLAILPVVCTTACTRPVGFNLLLSQFDGDTGAASSLLNFMTFMFGVIGMIIASLPFGNFFTAVGVCIAVGSALFIICYILLHYSKDRLKGLEEI